MKVLIATGLFPPESGGPATYSQALLTGLSERGIETVVLPFRKARKYPKIIRHVVYFFLVLSKGWKVDVIYAQDPVSVGLPALCASFILRKKFVLKVVGDYAWEQSTSRFNYKESIEYFQTDEENGILSKILRYIERRVARSATLVVVPSKYLGTIMVKWGIPKEKIHVIYNGIAPHEVGLKQVIRGLLRFRGELIISPGRLVPWKGFETLIRVHAELVKQRPNLKLLIAGDGPDGKKLEALTEKLGTQESVVFTQRVDNAVLLRYMRAADVFVLNTRYEGFSHILLEAATIGVPIITTKIGGNPEFIDDGTNGYLIKPDDEKALAKKITALLDSPERRSRLATNAKRKVEKFSVSGMVDNTAEMLKSI